MFKKKKKNMAKRIDLETLARKIVSYIGERDPWNFENETKEGGIAFSSYTSHLEFNAIRRERKKRRRGERGVGKKENRNRRERRKRSPRETDGF